MRSSDVCGVSCPVRSSIAKRSCSLSLILTTSRDWPPREVMRRIALFGRFGDRRFDGIDVCMWRLGVRRPRVAAISSRLSDLFCSGEDRSTSTSFAGGSIRDSTSLQIRIRDRLTNELSRRVHRLVPSCCHGARLIRSVSCSRGAQERCASRQDLSGADLSDSKAF